MTNLNTRTNNLNLLYLYPNQSQKEWIINEALNMLDAMIFRIVESRSFEEEPYGHNLSNSLYIVPNNAKNTWKDYEPNTILVYIDKAPIKIMPKRGMIFWINDESCFILFDGKEWNALQIKPTA